MAILCRTYTTPGRFVNEEKGYCVVWTVRGFIVVLFGHRKEENVFQLDASAPCA